MSRPIDEKGRRRLYLELLDGPLADAFDAIERLLIREASIERLLREARLLGDGEQRRDRLFHGPLPLLPEQRVDQGKIFVLVVLAGATREHESRSGETVEWEFAENVADLPRVDVPLLEFGECHLLEMRTVRAGHRCIFDDGDRRLV